MFDDLAAFIASKLVAADCKVERVITRRRRRHEPVLRSTIHNPLELVDFNCGQMHRQPMNSDPRGNKLSVSEALRNTGEFCDDAVAQILEECDESGPFVAIDYRGLPINHR